MSYINIVRCHYGEIHGSLPSIWLQQEAAGLHLTQVQTLELHLSSRHLLTRLQHQQVLWEQSDFLPPRKRDDPWPRYYRFEVKFNFTLWYFKPWVGFKYEPKFDSDKFKLLSVFKVFLFNKLLQVIIFKIQQSRIVHFLRIFYLYLNLF